MPDLRLLGFALLVFTLFGVALFILLSLLTLGSPATVTF